MQNSPEMIYDKGSDWDRWYTNKKKSESNLNRILNIKITTSLILGVNVFYCNIKTNESE